MNSRRVRTVHRSNAKGRSAGSARPTGGITERHHGSNTTTRRVHTVHRSMDKGGWSEE